MKFLFNLFRKKKKKAEITPKLFGNVFANVRGRGKVEFSSKLKK